jgi:adenylate cyclase
MPEQSDDQDDPDPAPVSNLGAALAPRLMKAMKIAREILPGDSRYGDPLSTTGAQPRQQVARRLGEAAQERPSILKEAGLSALQVWEAVSADDGNKLGDDRLAIVFTDLVGFSDWALEAGDDISLELLRAVSEAIEPPVTAHGGEVVKRLGDGMMAVFGDVDAAAAAVFEARERLDAVEIAGYRPRMRAGMHVGSPRWLAGDYLGVDVNIAARVAGAASGGQVLISEAARERLGESPLRIKRRRFFRAKGAPSDLRVYAVERSR